MGRGDGGIGARGWPASRSRVLEIGAGNGASFCCSRATVSGMERADVVSDLRSFACPAFPADPPHGA